MFRFGQRVLREMCSDGKRLTLLTSHTANFHVTVLFCFITPQITAVRNAEIRFGRGSDCIENSKKKNKHTKKKPAFIALAAEGAQKRSGNWEGGREVFVFLDTFILDGFYFFFSTLSAFFNPFFVLLLF